MITWDGLAGQTTSSMVGGVSVYVPLTGGRYTQLLVVGLSIGSIYGLRGGD